MHTYVITHTSFYRKYSIYTCNMYLCSNVCVCERVFGYMLFVSDVYVCCRRTVPKATWWTLPARWGHGAAQLNVATATPGVMRSRRAKVPATKCHGLQETARTELILEGFGSFGRWIDVWDSHRWTQGCSPEVLSPVPLTQALAANSTVDSIHIIRVLLAGTWMKLLQRDAKSVLWIAATKLND